MDFKNTKFSLTRPITSYGKVRDLIGALLRNRRAHISAGTVSTKEYLDIGCGPNPHRRFINLDYRWYPENDICWDITRKPGGTIRIIVPDGERYLTGYSDIIRGDSNNKLPYAELDALDGVYSPILSVNRIFRDHGHLFIYDFDLLHAMLVGSGFVDIRKEQFKSGRDPHLLIDTESRAIESLYVEATKPNNVA